MSTKAISVYSFKKGVVMSPFWCKMIFIFKYVLHQYTFTSTIPLFTTNTAYTTETMFGLFFKLIVIYHLLTKENAMHSVSIHTWFW